jgi:hypothetical protein
MSDSIVELFDSSSEGSAEETQEVSSEPEQTVENEVSEVETTETEVKEEVAEEVPTTSEEDSEKQQWTFHAVKDERAKRQQAEAKIKELEEKLAAPKPETPDVFEDPDGFVQSLQATHKEDLHRQRIEIYREMQQERHSDYLEKEAKFIELANENPILLTQMQRSSNPAKFAYEQAVKHEQFQEMQDTEAFREKIRAEERAKLEKELMQEKVEEKADAEKLSPSLAKARGSTDKVDKLTENPGDLFD